MSADRDITPRVIAYIRAELPTIERRRRVSPLVAQEVLRQLARWARRTDAPGQWYTTESVEQIVAGTGIASGTVRKALDNLERLGLAVTLVRGGGYGVGRRGSTRALLLDPTDTATARARRAEFDPQLRALATATARASDATARAQARASASSSASSTTRADGDVDDVAVPMPAYVAEQLARFVTRSAAS